MIALLLLALATDAVPAALRCGAVERPGVAERGSDGVWRGVAVDLCRTAAQARQASAIDFHAYRRIADLRAAGKDDLAVLTRAELAIAQPGFTPGTPVAISRQLLLVRPRAPRRDRSALSGQRVCFIIASPAEAALNAWAGSAHVAIIRVGFQEPGELRDGFDSGYCTAMAADAQDIPGGAAHTLELRPALSEMPLFALTAQ